MKKFLLIAALLFTDFVCFGQDSTNGLDEFEEFTNDSSVTSISIPAKPTSHKNSTATDIFWTTAVLLFTVVAAILVRFKPTRQLRSVFLVASMVVLGFYRACCPCSIQSFQHTILLVAGNFIRWPSVLLFTGLVVITYFVGRVYCGWICQLGALQEFIFKTSAFKLFQSERAQKIMRRIRITTLLILISQLLITRTNLYKQVDPFAAIYNFYSDYYIGWILVAIIMASSFVLYRPFCKTICPVGLVLGWISKIPGASVLGVKENCISCVKCTKECNIRAITHDSKIGVLNNQECIRCGECLSSCPKNALWFFKKSAKHLNKVQLAKKEQREFNFS